MKILGIETATSTTSVALQEEEKTLGQITTNTTIVHSKTLMPMIISLPLKGRLMKGQENYIILQPIVYSLKCK